MLLNSTFFLIYVASLVSLFTLYTIFRLKELLIGKRINWRAITIDTFLCLTLLLASLAIYSGNLEKTSTDTFVQSNITQFVGAVLAIFFGLAIVPISNIVGNTSFSFVYQIIRNEVFVKSVILYSLIIVVISIQGIFGFNKTVSLVHLSLLFISLITFIFLIYETIRLLDIRNIITDFERDAIFELDHRWRRLTSKTKDLNKQLQMMAAIKNALIYETKIKIEPIFITTKKYITVDHYDVVTKGLSSIVNITYKYIDLFSFSIQDNDSLLNYLIERFIDLKSAITDTSHYSILPNLVLTTKLLAIKSLDVKTHLSKYNQSYLPLGLINFLKDFVISKDIYKQTSSAPMDATYALEEVAIVAIQKMNYRMAHSALEALTEISVICTKLNFLYSNQVSKEANAAIMNIHYNILKTMGAHYDLVPFLEDSISKPIEAYIEVGEDSPRKDNLSPFIGTGVDPIGLFDPYSTSFFKHLPYIVFLLFAQNEASEDITLDYLEEVLSNLNQMLMKADRKRMFFLSNQIVDSAFDITFTLLQFIDMDKIKKTDKVKKLISDELFYIFSNSVSGSFLNDDNSLTDKVHRWFSALGLYILTFQTWDGFPMNTVNEAVKTANQGLPKLIDEYKGQKIVNSHVKGDLRPFFEYLNLALYWERTLLSNLLLEQNLVKFLIANEENLDMGFNDNRLPKPVTTLGGYWSLDQPCVAYYQQFLWDSREFLGISQDNLYRFEQYMKRYKLIWKLVQLIKFHLGEVKTYEIYGSRRRSVFF